MSTSNEEIAQVGTISANGDAEIGRFIADEVEYTDPSRRNSGLETTANVTSAGAWRPTMPATQSPVPIGTVLLLTMIVCPWRACAMV